MELWHDYTFICSFFLVARGPNPEGLPQLSEACLYSNPPLLLSLQVFLSPLLVVTLLISPIFFAPHTAILRGTAGEEGESNPPLIAVRYSAYGTRQGERRVNSSIAGLFNPSPRRYAPQFSPMFSQGNIGEKVGY